ncbi:hypothetical protein [uncultured Roseibium sp.]|uniref:hypothetical protein n=1 Tax=uncultured Roseibium sp. TaxID=1936171 RepID=UPI0026138A26|nr:hypothetical protein [uncultured Roseibium sp.]
MPPTDTRTANRNYPKADIANKLSDDMARVGGDGMDAVDADVQTLADAVAGKAAAGHGHAIGDISDLSNQLAALAMAIADNAGTLEGLTDTDTTGVTQGMILQFFTGGWKAVAGKASHFSLDPITGLTANNVQEAIAELITQVTTPSVEPAFQTYVTDGLTSRFTLPVTPNSKNVVFLNLNGVTVLHEDYTLEVADVVLNTVPRAGLTLNAIVLTAVEIGTPSAGAVGFPQLSTDTSQLALMRAALNNTDAPFRWNYLLNGNFARNTRGEASYPNSGYTLDRWRLDRQAGAFQTISQGGPRALGGSSKYNLVWERTATGASDDRLEQRIPDVRTLAGKTVTAVFSLAASADMTISFRMRQYFGTGGSPSSQNDFFREDIAVLAASGETQFKYSFTVPDVAGLVTGSNDNDFLGFAFIRQRTGGDGVVSLQNVGLYEGDLTNENVTFWDRGQLEEALCAHFCRVLNGYEFQGTATGSGAARFSSVFERMHRNPDVELMISTAVSVYSNGFKTFNPPSISSVGVNETSITFVMGGSSEMSNNHPAMCTHSGGLILLEADN